MNERIQELYEQAMGDLREEAYPTERSWGMDDVMEKFAELIVRECIGVLEGTLGMNNSTLQNMDAIKEHFGVK